MQLAPSTAPTALHRTQRGGSRRWNFRPVDLQAAERLAGRLNISPLTAQLMLQRGVSSAEAAGRFLRPDLSALHDPADFIGLEPAVDRIWQAIQDRQHIRIIGDYDVDGVTSTALLFRFLRLAGGRVSCRIPDRLQDGYGLKSPLVEEAHRLRAQLIITVDNGVKACAAIERAAELGIDVIVTDHHEPGPVLPAPQVLLNPKLPDSGYPFSGLCGCGVAFKLAWGVARRISKSKRVSPMFRRFLLDGMALVAVATVADMVPLTDENRALCRFGLTALGGTRMPGLQALARVCGIKGRPTAQDIGFGMGPRINAAGRLGKADLALELLLTECPQRAEALAQELDGLNRKRKLMQQETQEQALARLAQHPDTPAIVLADEGWHPGLVGIVASRLVDETYRPTILLSRQGARSKGSARSIPEVAIHRVLEGASNLLVRHGGHAQAAGVELETCNIPGFRELVGQLVAEQLEGKRPQPSLWIDAEVPLMTMNRAQAMELQQLGPFGQQNHQPCFASSELTLVGAPRRLGATGDHLAFKVQQMGAGPILPTIGFGLGHHCEALEALHRQAGRSSTLPTFSLAYELMLDDWDGRRSVKLKVKDLAL